MREGVKYKGILMEKDVLEKYQELKKREMFRTDIDFFRKLLEVFQKNRSFERKNVEIKNLQLKVLKLENELKDCKEKHGNIDTKKKVI